MITIESRIEKYQKLLQEEKSNTPTQWVLGVIFGLKLALHILRINK